MKSDSRGVHSLKDRKAPTKSVGSSSTVKKRKKQSVSDIVDMRTKLENRIPDRIQLLAQTVKRRSYFDFLGIVHNLDSVEIAYTVCCVIDELLKEKK